VLTDAAGGAADRAAALRAFEDTLAVMLAGWHEPVACAARRYAAGAGPALITGERVASAEHAAFAHAVAGHALDYDDVHLVSVTHPSVVIVPALMALADRAASGRSLLDAYGAGVSVNIALGQRLGFGHYARGWHATSTIGPLAAAAAGAHLLRLDEGGARSAIALAAAQAAGLQRNFGSMAKPVQAGDAAAAAVRAVLLAAEGVTGDADVFGERGVLDLYGADGEAPGPLKASDVHSVSLKLYPCCYGAHRLIAAAFDARAGLSRDDLLALQRIELTAPFETMRPLRIADPTSGAEAQFCAAYILAAALLQGQIGFPDFTDEAARRPDVRRLMDRVRIKDDAASGRPAVGLAYGEVKLRLTTADGRTIEARCATYPGSPQAPPSPDALDAKFADCAAVYAKASGRPFRRADLRRMALSLAGEAVPAS
jgi:2-methylcitrate dehydratase PrpD